MQATATKLTEPTKPFVGKATHEVPLDKKVDLKMVAKFMRYNAQELRESIQRKQKRKQELELAIKVIQEKLAAREARLKELTKI